jgi:molybdate transport system substrate-binding protein
MKKPVIIGLVLVAILAACCYALSKRNTSVVSNNESTTELTLYCAAGLREPISQITDAYTEETGRQVNIIYNGSGALLSQIKIGKGDLYLPANIAYIQDAAKAELIAEYMPAAYLTAVIVVHKDNTSIQSLEDLSRPGVRISFADETAAIGRFAREILIRHGAYVGIEKNIIVTKPTVNNIVEDVSLGSADATIAWGAVASNHPNLRTIEVPMFTQARQATAIALLKTSENPEAALHLAHTITTTNQARQIFKASGFELPPLADKQSDR